jgi:glycosyltransferase involved in cell wall biosynthesis
MNTSSPQFSIVMPTRNRGHLLPYALQSALDQKFDDYEIVVVDNCSSDATPKVVQQLGGARVRYVRTDRTLAMHDNWEFALTQARGEWITFLSDDDALYPQALATIADTLATHETQVVSWLTGAYFLDLPSAAYPERRRQVLMLKATGRTFTVPSRPDLVSLFVGTLGVEYRMPKMMNSCCRRPLTEKIKQQMGRFFLSPNPDFSSCMAMLAKTESYTFIDAPLALMGMGAHSLGVAPTSSRPTNHVDMMEDFQGGQILKYVPLSFLTSNNTIVETLLAVRAAMAPELDWLEPDWYSYFLSCYKDMMYLAINNLDITAMRQEYFAALAHRPLLFRARVQGRLLGPRTRFLFQKGPVRQAMNRLGILRLLEPFIGSRRRTVMGGKTGYANILEAVEALSPACAVANASAEHHAD